MTRRAATPGRAALAAALLGSIASAHAAPVAGRYEAQFCVAMSAGAPSCGAVEVDLVSRSAARVRKADIVYLLKLRPRQLDVVLKQGSMQLDEFSAHYEWDGDALLFADDEKNARYELRFGRRLR